MGLFLARIKGTRVASGSIRLRFIACTAGRAQVSHQTQSARACVACIEQLGDGFGTTWALNSCYCAAHKWPSSLWLCAGDVVPGSGKPRKKQQPDLQMIGGNEPPPPNHNSILHSGPPGVYGRLFLGRRRLVYSTHPPSHPPGLASAPSPLPRSYCTCFLENRANFFSIYTVLVCSMCWSAQGLGSVFLYGFFGCGLGMGVISLPCWGETATRAEGDYLERDS